MVTEPQLCVREFMPQFPQHFIYCDFLAWSIYLATYNRALRERDNDTVSSASGMYDSTDSESSLPEWTLDVHHDANHAVYAGVYVADLMEYGSAHNGNYNDGELDFWEYYSDAPSDLDMDMV